MTFQKGVKFRIYPNREQRNLIDRTLGCSRLIYNKGLAMREDAFKSGEKCGYKQTSAMLTALKQDVNYAFLKEVDSIALQQALRNLDTGYTNFFEHRAAHPKFKNKKSSKQSYHTLNIGNGIRISNKRIRLPKIGWVKVHQSMEIGAIHNATVVRTTTGKYFVVLNVEYDPQPMPNNGCVVIRVPTFYPSSQTCSCCGHKNVAVKNLSIRKWECPSCHTVHDRDKNAAINILRKGLEKSA